jgi:hypothetical protein
MRARVLSSVVLALAGAGVVFVSLHARTADLDRQSLRAAVVDGIPQRASGSAASAYLAALAAVAHDRKRAGAPRSGERAATIASAQQAVRAALARRQPAAQRSQLENLNAVLELKLSALGGDQAPAHRRAAARWLQQAVLVDDTNSDAKFNLELLIARDPQSARQQVQAPAASGTSKKRTHKVNRTGKNTSSHARELGDGF